MSENTQSSGKPTGLIGAAILIAAAGFGGYQFGFSNGEKGLIEAQNKMSLVEAASANMTTTIDEQTSKIEALSEQIATKNAQIETQSAQIARQSEQIETQSAQIASQSEQLETQSAQIANQSEQIEVQSAQLEKQRAEVSSLTTETASKDVELQTQRERIAALATDVSAKSTEIEKLAGQIDKLSGQVSLNGNALSHAHGKLADLTAQLSVADKENEAYLKTIMASMGKQDFNLHVGGAHKSLIEDQIVVGLSYISLDKKMARITVAGEQMNVNLQSPETIRLKGHPCNLTLANLVSDTQARFQFSCDR